MLVSLRSVANTLTLNYVCSINFKNIIIIWVDSDVDFHVDYSVDRNLCVQQHAFVLCFINCYLRNLQNAWS